MVGFIASITFRVVLILTHEQIEDFLSLCSDD